MSSLAVLAALAAGIQASIIARAISTLEVPIPTGQQPFTSTVQGCDTVAPFAVVGVPTGTFGMLLAFLFECNL